VWKLLKKVNKTGTMKSVTTTTRTKDAWSSMARVNAKTIHTVRHVYMATLTVLLMWQTQCFILTVSPPADL